VWNSSGKQIELASPRTGKITASVARDTTRDNLSGGGIAGGREVSERTRAFNLLGRWNSNTAWRKNFSARFRISDTWRRGKI